MEDNSNKDIKRMEAEDQEEEEALAVEKVAVVKKQPMSKREFFRWVRKGREAVDQTAA